MISPSTARTVMTTSRGKGFGSSLRLVLSNSSIRSNRANGSGCSVVPQQVRSAYNTASRIETGTTIPSQAAGGSVALPPPRRWQSTVTLWDSHTTPLSPPPSWTATRNNNNNEEEEEESVVCNYKDEPSSSSTHATNNLNKNGGSDSGTGSSCSHLASSVLELYGFDERLRIVDVEHSPFRLFIKASVSLLVWQYVRGNNGGSLSGDSIHI